MPLFAATVFLSAFLLLNIRTIQRYFAGDSPEELYRQCTEQLGDNIPNDNSFESAAAAKIMTDVCQRIKTESQSEPTGDICTRARTGTQQIARE